MDRPVTNDLPKTGAKELWWLRGSDHGDERSTGGSPYYANCAAACSAGAAPLHRVDPGYRSGLDRDNDGVACE
jgi:Excalibur calcium-binding domain